MIRHITTRSVAVLRKLATSTGTALLVLAAASAEHAMAVPMVGGPGRASTSSEARRVNDPERIRMLNNAFRGRSRQAVPQENRVALTTIRNDSSKTVYFEAIDPQIPQLGWRKASLAPGRTVLFTQYLGPQDEAKDVQVRYKERQKSAWSHSDEPWSGYRLTKNLLPRVVVARGVVSPQVIQGRVQEVVDRSKLRGEHVHQYVFVDFVTDADILAEAYNKSEKPTYNSLELITEDAARRRRLRNEQLRQKYEDQRRRQVEQRLWGYERPGQQHYNTSNSNSAREMREESLRRLGKAAAPGQSIVDRIKRSPYPRP